MAGALMGRLKRLILSAGLVAMLLATAWMLWADLQTSCGLGWDALNIRMCGYVAIARELITVNGAILGMTAYFAMLAGDE